MSNKIVIVISTISLIVSVVAICLVLMRCEPIETEWAAIEVTVLSVLVTLLLGWQIWSVVGFEKRVNNINDRIDKQVVKIASDFNHITTASEYKWNAADILCDPTDPANSVKWWIKALEEASKTETACINEAVIDNILTSAKEDIDYFISNKKVLFLTESEKEKYISVAMAIKNKKAVNLIMFISKATPPENSNDNNDTN